jgi:acetyl esterase
MSDNVLHPQALALLEGMKDVPRITDSSVEQARAMSGGLKQMLGDGPEVGEIHPVSIAVDGANVDAIVYEPPGDDPCGVIVYFHGGGFVVGAPSDFDALYRTLVFHSNCRLVSVDYRLAPEYAFPVGVDDCYAALLWVSDHLAGSLPITVAGDSSGATFAAVCAQRARDEGGPRLAFQALVYPVVDHSFDTPSYAEHGDSGLLVGRDDMRWFWDHYAPDPAVRDDPKASPLRAASLANLPPAYVLIAEFDPLRDEGRAYAQRLDAAGVRVTVDYIADQLHGFFTLVNLMESADQAARRVATAIRAASLSSTADLANPTASPATRSTP